MNASIYPRILSVEIVLEKISPKGAFYGKIKILAAFMGSIPELYRVLVFSSRFFLINTCNAEMPCKTLLSTRRGYF
jgi:hypothetical protein